MSQRKSIAIFCGSSSGSDPAYVAAAHEMGRAIAERGYRLVYGAGSVGLMGEVADEVLRQGGEVLGVIPQFLVDMEVGHDGLTELIVTETMHERKLAMAEAADGFIAMPGGVGTLEEIIEVLTWTQLGVHDKQCGLYDVKGYYDHLVRFLEHAVDQRFLKASQAALLHRGADAGALLETVLESGGVVYEGKWVG
ncbi:TIGR00730 family Rossman fold protein [Lewinella sp. 4G2]|uniref:LOG family protein n=1 Tax=Lewinella sp. 4G2 TaxID=1803372 RepID=UPI0007B46882|nr:TIGR00730 family Rossman fold protein [Lewinella sp. 4G2]OAV44789.1 Rossman fold protein, TIGR00730 family [Lewinella sp. 4G2]